jgi:hypothetical protein
MPFGVAKNGMRMYMPTWQMNPGSSMKAANRKASDAYFANVTSLGSGFISAMGDQTAGIVDLTAKIANARIQADFQKKLQQAQAGLDVII